MDNIEINNLDPTDLPFFARFLEGQMEDISEPEAAEVAGGRRSNLLPINVTGATNKYPSDGDDQDLGGQTRKYPSDSEDGVVMTQKFPSDGEDNTGGNPIAMTKKYPSDHEEGCRFQ